MSGLRAVFFDMGGTLFSNHEVARVSMPVLEEAARRLGVDGGLAALAPIFLEATRATGERYRDRPSYLHRDMLMETCRSMVQRLGGEPDEAFLDWFYVAQREVIVRDLKLRSDCLDTLAALRDRGLARIVVSNVDDDYFEPMMRNLGLDAFFDSWISSESAGSCKPDPRIFHAALERAGCRPEQALFVGDSRIHDVQGARAVGMPTVLLAKGGVSHLDDQDFDSEPDHVIRRLGELVAIVDARLAGADPAAADSA